MAEVIIPVTADVSKAEKELDKIEAKKKQLEIRKMQLEIDEQQAFIDLQKIDNEIEKVRTKMEEIGRSTKFQFGDPSVVAKYNELNNQMDLLTQKGDMYAQRLELVKAEMTYTTTEYQKQEDKAEDLSKTLDEVIDKQNKAGISAGNTANKEKDADNNAKQHSNSLSDIIRKVTHWGLAIVGIRSLYQLVRGAIGQVASRNEEVGAKLEQMKNVLYGAITPIIQTIVNWLMKAMQYVNYLTKALFGKEIFNFKDATENSSKNMKSTQKSASGTAKALKQASKQLAGFDEMNVLSDNKSSGGGGTSGGGGVGGLDTSGLKDMKNMFDDLGDLKVPQWLESVKNALKPVVDRWKTVIWAIGEKQRLDQIEKDNEAGKHADNLKRQKSLETQGTQIIKNAKAQKQMTDQEFIYIRGIEDEIIGLKKKGKLTDSEKERLRILTNRYGDLYREGVLNNSQMELYRVITGKTKVAEEDRTRVMKNLVTESINTYNAEKNVADGAEQVAEATKDGTYWVDDFGVSLETMTKEAGLSKEQTDQLRDALNKYNKSDKGPVALSELGGIIEAVGKKAGLSKDKIEELGRNINGLKNKKVEVTVDQNTNVKTNFINTGKEMLRKTFKAMGYTDAQLKSMGLRKGGIIQYARGGIINQPGRGVPLAYGGEAGREGVIPLTDSQQMALLGEAIGKYITINANITNSMNGRILSRELQKIQNEQNFASNRW